MIKFECGGCSGCCHGGISVTLSEAIDKYYRYFPFIGVFSVADVRNVPIEKDKDSYSKSMKAFSKENLSFYSKTKDNRKIVVHPQIVSLNHPELPCLNLSEEKLCSIYSFKPKACSLYPYRIDTPVAHMEKGLLRERQRAFDEEEHIPCGGWENSSNIIFTTKGPSDNRVIDLFKQRASESQVATRFLKDYFDYIRENDREVEKKIGKYSQLNDNSGNIIQFTVVDFINYLVNKNQLSKTYLPAFIDGQITSYDKFINLLLLKDNDKYNLILNIAKTTLLELRNLKKQEV